MSSSTLKAFACTGLCPVSLSSGRAVSPGETFDMEPTEHDERLIEAGLITRLAPKALGDLNRVQLNERAETLGVGDVDSFKTKADIVAAIEAREATIAAEKAGE
jgi:hypothetical protein